jgi:hypothetical protein
MDTPELPELSDDQAADILAALAKRQREQLSDVKDAIGQFEDADDRLVIAAVEAGKQALDDRDAVKKMIDGSFLVEAQDKILQQLAGSFHEVLRIIAEMRTLAGRGADVDALLTHVEWLKGRLEEIAREFGVEAADS